MQKAQASQVDGCPPPPRLLPRNCRRYETDNGVKLTAADLVAVLHWHPALAEWVRASFEAHHNAGEFTKEQLEKGWLHCMLSSWGER